MKIFTLNDDEIMFIKLILNGTISVDYLDDEEIEVYQNLRKKFGLPEINPQYLADKNFE